MYSKVNNAATPSQTKGSCYSKLKHENTLDKIPLGLIQITPPELNKAASAASSGVVVGVF